MALLAGLFTQTTRQATSPTCNLEHIPRLFALRTIQKSKCRIGLNDSPPGSAAGAYRSHRGISEISAHRACA